MKQLHVFIDADLYRAIQLLAVTGETTVSAIVRSALIAAVLESYDADRKRAP